MLIYGDCIIKLNTLKWSMILKKVNTIKISICVSYQIKIIELN